MTLERHVVRASLVVAALTAVFVLAISVGRLLAGAHVHVRPWLTVIAATCMLGSAVAGSAGRTWGVLLLGVCATTFLGAWTVGVAPSWFVAVFALGAAPLAIVSPRLLGVDAAATIAAVLLVFVAGAVAAAAAGPGLDALPR